MKNIISQTTPNEQQLICQSGPQQAENQSRSTKKRKSSTNCSRTCSAPWPTSWSPPGAWRSAHRCSWWCGGTRLTWRYRDWATETEKSTWKALEAVIVTYVDQGVPVQECSVGSLLSLAYQAWYNIFLSHQTSEQYFLTWLVNETNRDADTNPSPRTNTGAWG
jgi:hypothetical protein